MKHIRISIFLLILSIICSIIAGKGLSLSAYAESDIGSAYNRILVYNQNGTWAYDTDKYVYSLYYGRNVSLNLSGCHIYTYAHAIQWLTSQPRNASNGGELLSELIRVLSGESPESGYAETIFKNYVINNNYGESVSTAFSESSLEALFSQGGVVISNPKGHYNLAVGMTHADFDNNGSQEAYVHIVDSSCQSTWWRLNSGYSYSSTGFTAYSYNNHSVITGYSRYKENGVNKYVTGTNGTNFGGGEYWVSFGAYMAAFQRRAAYTPKNGYRYLTDPIIYNAEYYRNNNADLSTFDDQALLNHWLTSGVKEGRCASPVFYARYYVNAYSDLSDAFGSDYATAIKHFITSGVSEGRTAHEGFAVNLYKANYKDLQDIYGNENYGYCYHYVTCGASEGRIANRRLTIQLNANGGNVDTAQIEVTNFSKYGGLPIPKRDGFSFMGWYTAIDGGNLISADSIVDYHQVSTLYAHWTAAVADNPPTIDDVTVTDITSSGYTITCGISDDIGVKEVRVAAWTDDDGGQDDIIWYQATVSNGIATCRVDTIDHAHQCNCGYMNHIYVYDTANNITVVNQTEYNCLYVNVPSVICNVTIESVTNEGYTVRFNVDKDWGVSRAQCPAWTDNNGQDDIVWHDATINGNECVCTILTNQHNNETGSIFRTHLYVWDKDGNAAYVNQNHFPCLLLYVPTIEEYLNPDPTGLEVIPSDALLSLLEVDYYGEMEQLTTYYSEHIREHLTVMVTYSDNTQRIVDDYDVDTWIEHDNNKPLVYRYDFRVTYGDLKDTSEISITLKPTPVFGAPDFTLPTAISTVDESAFEGIAATIVYIPDTCTSIGKWTFKDCSKLTQIRIPDKCSIGTDAFSGCVNIVIFGTKGSAAENYANTHANCTFVAE